LIDAAMPSRASWLGPSTRLLLGFQLSHVAQRKEIGPSKGSALT
jgi:hypothetical protein